MYRTLELIYDGEPEAEGAYTRLTLRDSQYTYGYVATPTETKSFIRCLH